MRCHGCGREIEQGRTQCPYCGAALALYGSGYNQQGYDYSQGRQNRYGIQQGQHQPQQGQQGQYQAQYNTPQGQHQPQQGQQGQYPAQYNTPQGQHQPPQTRQGQSAQYQGQYHSQQGRQPGPGYQPYQAQQYPYHQGQPRQGTSSGKLATIVIVIVVVVILVVVGIAGFLYFWVMGLSETGYSSSGGSMAAQRTSKGYGDTYNVTLDVVSTSGTFRITETQVIVEDDAGVTSAVAAFSIASPTTSGGGYPEIYDVPVDYGQEISIVDNDCNGNLNSNDKIWIKDGVAQPGYTIIIKVAGVQVGTWDA